MKKGLLKTVLKNAGEILLTIAIALAGIYIIFTIQGRAPSRSPAMDFNAGRNEQIIGLQTSEVSARPVPQYVDTVKDPEGEDRTAVMGDILAYQPVITNTGNTHLHAFFEIQRGLVDFAVEEGWEDIIRSDGSVPGTIFDPSDDWELIEERSEDDMLYSVYHYKTILSPSETTMPLFNYCQIAWLDIDGKTYNETFDHFANFSFEAFGSVEDKSAEELWDMIKKSM